MFDGPSRSFEPNLVNRPWTPPPPPPPVLRRPPQPVVIKAPRRATSPIKITRRKDNADPIQDPGLFETIYRMDHSKDLTVHLSLPIVSDFDTELEVFSQLLRLGDFTRAEGYFKENLENHLNHPYVFVRYAEMLLAKGDYLGFEKLDGDVVFGDDKGKRAASSAHSSRKYSRSVNRGTHALNPDDLDYEGDSEIGIHMHDEPRSRNRMGGTRQRSMEDDDHVYYYSSSDLDSGNDDYDHDHDFPRTRHHNSSRARTHDPAELLRRNWRLMKALVVAHRKGVWDSAFDEVISAIRLSFEGEIGSTEVRTLSCGSASTPLQHPPHCSITSHAQLYRERKGKNAS